MPSHRSASVVTPASTPTASPTPAIFPSLISADLLNLEKVLAQLDSYCAGYHLDVMDNQFVPNLTWGPAFINAIARKTKRRLWVHLMLNNPIGIMSQLVLPENSIITVHLESIPAALIPVIIQKIKDKKWRPSLAIKPKTPVSALAPYLDLIDHLLIMSVEPGFSGQDFLPETELKIDQLLTLIQQKHHSRANRSTILGPITLALDGGVTQKNIAPLARKGVTQFAVAQAIFGQPDPVKALEQLQKAVK